MTSLRSIGLGLALALVASSAMGFQEQKAGSSAPAAAAAPAQVDQKPAAQVAPGAAETGPEVRIPGIGKLGVLPKMDFGLELLYGAAEGKPAADVPRDNNEDLTIRGSVKHRF